MLPSRTLKERDSKKAPALSAVLTEANDNGPLSSKNAVSILKDPVLPLAEADPSSEPALENEPFAALMLIAPALPPAAEAATDRIEESVRMMLPLVDDKLMAPASV